MADPFESADTIDWKNLIHSDGIATNTPGKLRQLLEDDEALQANRMQHLYSTMLHPLTATGPTAKLVAQATSDEQLEPVREYLLDFLIAVVESPINVGELEDELKEMASFDTTELVARAAEIANDPDADSVDVFEEMSEIDGAMSSLVAQGVLGCLTVIPDIEAAFQRMTNDPDPDVQAKAVKGLAAITELRELFPA